MFGCLVFLVSLVTFGQSLPQHTGQNAPQVVVSAPFMKPVVNTQKGTSKTGDALICLLCIDIVQQAVKAISDPKMQNQIETGAKNAFCSVFKDQQYGLTCRNRIETYAPLAFAVITKNLDPQTCCEDISLCHESPLPPPESHWLADLIQSANTRSATSSSLQASGEGVTCDVCLFFVHAVVDQIVSEGTKEKVDAVVEKICNMFPSGLQQKCGVYVHKLVVTVIQTTTSDLIHPSEICKFFRFCSSDENNGLSQGETVKTGQDIQQVATGDHTLHF